MRYLAISCALIVVAACASEVATIDGRDVGDGEGTGAEGGEGGAEITPPACPNMMPAEGAGCAAEGQACDWTSFGCEHHAVCTDGVWSIESTTGCASEECGPEGCKCPEIVPDEGDKCEGPGLECAYPPHEGCGYGFVATCDGAAWVVDSLQPGCELTCPDWPDEDFLSATCNPCCHHACFGGSNCSYYWTHCIDGAWVMSKTPC